MAAAAASHRLGAAGEGAHSAALRGEVTSDVGCERTGGGGGEEGRDAGGQATLPHRRGGGAAGTGFSAFILTEKKFSRKVIRTVNIKFIQGTVLTAAYLFILLSVLWIQIRMF